MSANILKKEEDLRHEKEVISELDASRKALEQQLKDTQARIEEAEEFAKREAKRLNSKLESRVIFFINFVYQIFMFLTFF